ncbi:MAG: GNAT family N-acetyltransferase [Lentisphaeria bacterium]|nr:GNAT family N-acetyltransferase [Lentisphaeria bacterium]
MEITFEELRTPEELVRVRNIADVIWPETFKDILSPEQIRYMMQMMYAPEVMENELASGYHFAIVLADGRDAGYLVYSAYEEAGTAKLHKVYLLQDFHHQGVGQKMLEYACSRCRELGFSSVLLAVNKQNLPAQKAYLRHGFSMEKSVKCDIGHGFFMDDYLMRKAL